MQASQADESIDLYRLTRAHQTPLIAIVDSSLGLQVCPEFELTRYQVRPPEDHPMIGSWRNGNASAFAFLFRLPAIEEYERYQVRIVGAEEHVALYKEKIEASKASFQADEKKVLRARLAGEKLNAKHTQKALAVWAASAGMVAGVVQKGLSWIRDAGPPNVENELWLELHQLLVLGTHYISLLMFFLAALGALYVMCAYLLLLLRRNNT